MKLGILNGIGGKVIGIDIARIKAAESMGYDSVWTAEAYGSDAVSPAAWILAQTDKIKVGTAIMQMPGRSPACTAMTAMTLNQLSGGRFIVGLGASGPQVVEGWHGVAYGKPMTRTKEYVSILRKIFAREGPVEHEGFHYSLPYSGDDGTGLGKPLKSILQADTGIPIYTASITPKGLETAAEVADGVFPIWMSPEKSGVLEQSIRECDHIQRVGIFSRRFQFRVCGSTSAVRTFSSLRYVSLWSDRSRGKDIDLFQPANQNMILS